MVSETRGAARCCGGGARNRIVWCGGGGARHRAGGVEFGDVSSGVGRVWHGIVLELRSDEREKCCYRVAVRGFAAISFGPA